MFCGKKKINIDFKSFVFALGRRLRKACSRFSNCGLWHGRPQRLSRFPCWVGWGQHGGTSHLLTVVIHSSNGQYHTHTPSSFSNTIKIVMHPKKLKLVTFLKLNSIVRTMILSLISNTPFLPLSRGLFTSSSLTEVRHFSTEISRAFYLNYAARTISNTG